MDEEKEIKELLEGGGEERSKIVGVDIKRAQEVYGEKAKDPERSVAVITAENGANLTMGVPKGMSYNDGAWSIESKLKAMRSIQNKLSNFGAFLRKYGHYPNVGVGVETGIDDSGFARIVI